MRAIPRIKKKVKPKTKIKERLPVEKSEAGGVLGSDRLTDTLDTLCGDDLPKKGDALSTENTVLLVLVAAVILYYLFFKGRGAGSGVS